MLFSCSEVLFRAIVKFNRCGPDICLITDVAFLLVYNIACRAADVGKWALTRDFYKLEFIFIFLKRSLLFLSRSCGKHISGVFVFRPNLLDRLDNIK